MQLSKIYLAPMEGVCDPPMRKVLSHYGEYDECFSEFIRVTTEVLPYKTLLREVPELETDGKTAYGCPCRVQLLGDVPEPLAKTALCAVELGAKAIDLNFGCPSRFVHHGGALLLKEPDLLHAIVSRVREALPSDIFLSVKIRLGVHSADELPEILKAIAVEGLNEIIIHGRTRKDLYNEDALNWQAIGTAWDYVGRIPVVANGDILSAQTCLDCYRTTKADRQMIGRAVFATPNLPQVMRSLDLTQSEAEAKASVEPMSTAKMLQVVKELADELKARDYPDKSVMDRLKQFMGYAQKYDSCLKDFFRVFCRMQESIEAQRLLDEKVEALLSGRPLAKEREMAELLERKAAERAKQLAAAAKEHKAN